MNYRISIIFILMLLNLPLSGQVENFNKTYDFDEQMDFAISLLEEDSSFIIVGTSSVILHRRFMFFKVNKNGDSIYFNNWNPTYHVPNEIIKWNNETYLTSMQFGEFSSEPTQVGLALLDQKGDTIWCHYYGRKDALDAVRQMHITKERNIFLVGLSNISTLSGSKGEIYLIKTDSTGNLLWEKYYGDTSSGIYEYGYDILPLPNGDFLISGNQMIGGKNNLLLLRIDSAGNQKWLKTYGGHYDAWGGYLAATKDGNILYSGTIEVNPNNKKGHIMKLDTDGKILWDRYYGDSLMFQYGLSKIINSGENEYVIIGYIRDQSTQRNVGWIVKIDCAGNLLWERNYRLHSSAHCNFKDIINTTDGGFLVGGYVSSNPVSPTDDMWLLKLDSMGCDTLGCHQQDTTGNDIPRPCNLENMTVYPNPSGGRFHISLTGITSGIVRLYLYDRLGRQVFTRSYLPADGRQEEEIDVRHLAAGVYLLEVHTGENRWVRKIIVN